MWAVAAVVWAAVVVVDLAVAGLVEIADVELVAQAPVAKTA